MLGAQAALVQLAEGMRRMAALQRVLEKTRLCVHIRSLEVLGSSTGIE
jgi:hypothetical protein